MSLPSGVTTLQKKHSSGYVYLISAIAAVAGLLFGFDIAVINGAIIFLKEQFHLSILETEFATSSLLVGCVFGAIMAGVLSDWLGRKRILLVAALLFAVSAFGAALPRNLTEFVIARFIGGIAVGAASLLAPLYIAEISPPNIRGRLVSLNQMAIVTGILLSYLVNWLLSFSGSSGWRWMFASAAVPSIGFFIGLFFVPESPRWLTKQGCYDKALETLARVGGPEHARTEMLQIKEAIAEEAGSVLELLKPGLRRPLIIAVVLAILQQITGINTVLFYGSIIFKEQVGNHSESAAVGMNVIIGIINFLCTIVALWIIDKAGRKPLLMFASAGMAISLVLLGLAFLFQPPPTLLILTCMLLCVASFGVGMGPGVWVVISELFPTRIRGRAMSIATVSLWIACVALTFTFLSLVQAITVSGAFWVYASMCVVTFVFVWRGTPETKGKTLEEIERMWKH